MSYNFRSTSYTGNKLDNELRKYGAATFGTQTRKQTRLQRFMNLNDKLETLQQVRTADEMTAAAGLMRLRSHHMFFDEDGNHVKTR